MTVSDPNTDAHATQTYLGLVGNVFIVIQCSGSLRRGVGQDSGSLVSSSSDCCPLGKWLKVDFTDAKSL